MDELDIKILNLVQRNNHLPVERLAEEVALSPSAIRRRLRRLNEEGIIESNVAIISPEAVGLKLMAIVEVTLEREQPRILEEFRRAMLSAPEVMQCYYVTGIADFILVVTVKDTQDYDAFTRQYFFGNPNVKRFQTNVVLNRVKSGLTVPLRFKNP